MNEPAVFVLADRTLNGVIEQVRDNQWDMTLSPSFQTGASDHPPTLREIVNYHAYDDAWVPDMLAGRTMQEAGSARFDGDLLGDDPKGAFARIVDAACAAVEALDDLERVVHCSFGDYPAAAYLWQINSFRALRAHDIARAIGAPSDLPADLVQGVWEEISPHAEEWRSIGVFPAAIAVPDDAPLQDRLLALTGRDPHAH